MNHSPHELIAVASAAPATLALPAYALDGRPIRWNHNRTAAVFRSTADEYHSDKDAVSASMLRQLARSPAHLQSYLQQSHSGVTAARRFGTAVHMAVLETHLFRSSYAVYTMGDRRGQDWEDFKLKNPGKEILKPDELTNILGAARAALHLEVASLDGKPYRFADMVAAGETEVNYYWLDVDTGLTCKARMDLVAGNAVVDIKTTDDTRQESFGPHADKMGYDIQAAFYLRARIAHSPELAGQAKFYFLAIEDQPPYAPMLHQADDAEFVHFGDQKVSRLLKVMAQCRHTGRWPSYPQPTSTLKLPLYRRYPGRGLDI